MELRQKEFRHLNFDRAWVRLRVTVRMDEGEGVGQGAGSAVISKNFLQLEFFSPSHFPKTSVGIKFFFPTALAQTGTFCTSGVGQGEGASW
jgi:hypothetical protein